MLFYLLNISLPFHRVYIAVFWVDFHYTGSLWYLFIVEAPPCGWHWTSGLSRFTGWGSLHQCCGGWSWISSLWSAMKCPVVSFEVSVCLVWLGHLYFNAWGYVPAFGELTWYVLLWNVLALQWSLVSGQVWRLLDELLLINVPWSREFSGVLKFWI